MVAVWLLEYCLLTAKKMDVRSLVGRVVCGGSSLVGCHTGSYCHAVHCCLAC